MDSESSSWWSYSVGHEEVDTDKSAGRTRRRDYEKNILVTSIIFFIVSLIIVGSLAFVLLRGDREDVRDNERSDT